MLIFFLRLIGAIIGYVIANWLVNRSIFGGTGEAAIGAAIAFWAGGWVIVLFHYVVGITVGFWAIIPIINGIGRLVQRFIPEKADE